MSISRVLSLLALGAVIGCGPTNRTGNGNGDDANNNGNDGNGPTADAAACAASSVKADKIPLDMMIMLDQSSSMSDAVTGGTKWDAVKGALDTFVGQPGLAGVSVGIQYFGLPAGGGTCSTLACNVPTDCGASACGPCIANVCVGALTSGGSDSCTASDYAGAAVEIAPLPGVAPMIVSSIAAHSPTTSTPTSAALQGVIDHAKGWAQAHANDAVVVVFATDGDPTECDTSLANINAIAAAGAAGTPKILTFVIGVGSSLASLNGIAAAGGTTSAFLVDTGGNTNQQFLDAMNAIRHSVLGCQYQIPAPTMGSPDYGTVNVVFTNNGVATTFPYVMTKQNCPASGDGWYYDNPASPTQIILCDATCTRVEADHAAEVDITLGCATVIP